MGPAQLIYAVSAVAMAGALSLSVSRGIFASKQLAFRNQMLTQVSGVANEILEDIGSTPFDDRTRPGNFPAPPNSAAELTQLSNFGGNCDPEATCDDIDDFHGKSFSREPGGIPFNVDVSVKYVSEDDPASVETAPTFAKEVTLTITTPYVYRGTLDHPIKIVISRVFTYFKNTTV